MKKLLVMVLLLGVLSGSVYAAWRVWRPKPASASVAVTAKVERGDIRSAVASQGRVVANLDVDIKCKASGAIIKLPFDVSDPVREGDLLVELDPQDMRRILDQATVELDASKARLVVARNNLAIAERTLATDRDRAEAAVKSAEARARDARAKADRMKELWDKKLASQEDAETAETASVQAAADLSVARIKIEELKTQEQALELRRQDVKLAQTQVTSDEINQKIASDRLEDTKVQAPMDGVVTARSVQLGQIIASAVSNVGGGTTVLTLSDLSKVFVLATVDESYIGKVRVGQDAEITADAFPGERFKGTVVRIATRGTSVSSVVTFEVKIEVLGERKAKLKPEMTANVELIIDSRKDVLLVPAEATARRGGRQYVTVADGDRQEERPVELGINNGTQTEVVSGLTEGETVLVRRDGDESKWSQRPGGPPRSMLMPGRPPGGGRR